MSALLRIMVKVRLQRARRLTKSYQRNERYGVAAAKRNLRVTCKIMQANSERVKQKVSYRDVEEGEAGFRPCGHFN